MIRMFWLFLIKIEALKLATASEIETIEKYAGDTCPKAGGIIHLGATYRYVGDNTDIILMQSALLQIRNLLLNAIDALSEFAME